MVFISCHEITALSRWLVLQCKCVGSFVGGENTLKTLAVFCHAQVAVVHHNGWAVPDSNLYPRKFCSVNLVRGLGSAVILVPGGWTDLPLETTLKAPAPSISETL